MSLRVVYASSLKSPTSVILAEDTNRYAISADLSIDDLEDNECVTKAMLETAAPADTGLTIDVPIGTSSPFEVDISAFSNKTPEAWVEIVRQESPLITEQIYMPILRTWDGDKVITLTITFPDNPTTDHFQLIIK